jgi:hypothetical protein
VDIHCTAYTIHDRSGCRGHTLCAHNILLHCTPTPYSYTVLLHRTPTLYSYTVLYSTGTMVGLMGESGSGKSTLFQVQYMIHYTYSTSYTTLKVRPPLHLTSICPLDHIQLLQRFYDPTAGGVYIDGRDIREYNPMWLREQVQYIIHYTPHSYITRCGCGSRYSTSYTIPVPLLISSDVAAGAGAVHCALTIHSLYTHCTIRCGCGSR